MAPRIVENSGLGERIYENTLPSGLKCYIIPKCGFGEKQAYIAVKYGSNDIRFRAKNGDRQAPAGVAHFIEHKLFEEEWGNVFPEFSKGGADVNAFTDCNKTAYYFSCKNQFYENLGRLLDFVQSPYFTEESAEREKSIIGQEIMMFDDDANWKVYYQMLAAMYQNHPVRIPIAGSRESIEEIGRDTLYQNYQAFYCPENMAVVVVGDLEAERVVRVLAEHIKENPAKRAKTIYGEEPSAVLKKQVESSMEIGTPLFQIGYKHKPLQEDCRPEKIFGMKLLLDLIAGESTPFFGELYENGVLEEPLGLQYLCGEEFSFSVFGGNAKEPGRVLEALEKRVAELKENGLEEADFLRIQKKQLGRFIRGFNSVNAIALAQLDAAMRGSNLADGFLAIRNMKKDYLEQILRREFQKDTCVLSIVRNK